MSKFGTSRKSYVPPQLKKLKLSAVYGTTNCKTASPTGGANVGGSCDGTLGSPPAQSPCSSIGS